MCALVTGVQTCALPISPCRSADECRAARDAKVHQFTTFSYMELFHLPRAQLKSRLGKQKSRHFCRMGHDGIMSARELQKAPVGPGPSIGSAGCRNREGGRGAVNEGCRTAVADRDRKRTRLNSSH